MTTESYVQLPTDTTNTGKQVDTFSVTVGSNTQLRQVMVIGDPTNAANVVTVTNNALDVAVNDGFGNPLMTSSINGTTYLQVDPSFGANDNVIYTGTTVPQIGIIGGKGSDGNTHVASMDSTGALLVHDNEIIKTISNSLSSTGDIITSLDTTGYTALTLDLTGSFQATFQAYSSVDGITWNILRCYDPQTQLYPMDSFQLLGGVGQFSLPSRYFKLSVIQYTSGTITATINLRNRPVSQAVDNLALALDETNDVRLSIRNADILKDSRNAQVISDAPNMIFGELSSTTAAASQLVMDTTGYQSISVEVAGTFSATFGFWASNDGANWTAVAGYPSAGSGTPVSTNAGVGMFIVPAIGKYFKINLTAYTSGTVLCNCYLRSSPMPFLTNTTFVNTSQIGATAVVTAGVAGMQAVGGNIAAGVAPTANPILTAGIDTTGLTRRLYTDTTGRLIPVALDNTNTYRTIGVLPPASNPQNIGPTPVYITDTFEGQSLIELIGQLLLEMRITNQYLYELPRMLNASISIQDEPAAMRADATLFAQ